MRPHLAALALLLLSACALPAREEVALPPSFEAAGAPPSFEGMIFDMHAAFADPSRLDAAGAARAMAELEFVAAEMGLGGPRRDLDPQAALPLRQGRAEARAAIGLRADAPPQAAMEALFAAAAALRAGDRGRAANALGPVSASGAAPLERLAALPALPAVQAGTTRAMLALERRATPVFAPRRLADRS